MQIGGIGWRFSLKGLPSHLRPLTKNPVHHNPKLKTLVAFIKGGDHRHEALDYWLEAYRLGNLKKGSTLFISSAIKDTYINSEHLTVPDTLEAALKSLEESTGTTKSSTWWWGNKNDVDDGMDWNEEYVIPALAIGLIGKVIFLGQAWGNCPDQGRIVFTRDKTGTLGPFGELLFYPEAPIVEAVAGGKLFNIPYEFVPISKVLGLRVPDSSIFHVEESFSREILMKMTQKFQPGVVTILERLVSSFYD